MPMIRLRFVCIAERRVRVPDVFDGVMSACMRF